MSPRQLRSRLVLLDAGVVIEAFRTGTWNALVARFHVVLSKVIVDEEALYYETDNERREIDLKPYIGEGTIEVVSVEAARADAFLARFGRGYAERMHAGELELLTELMHRASEDDSCRMCSGDSIVFKVLGKMLMSDRGVSLEELLAEAGITKPLRHQFRREFRIRNATTGFGDSFGSVGR